MKIYKENIKRIIQILDEKYNELEDGECFEFKDDKLVKIDSFILPYYWYLPLIDDFYEHTIIINWLKSQGVYSQVWDNDVKNPKKGTKYYHLHGKGLYHRNGYHTPLDDSSEITFEQFKQYVLNK